MEEDKHGGHASSLVGEAVGVTLAHSLQQAVTFHLAQVIAELIEGIGLRGKGKSLEDGLPDLYGPPPFSCDPTVEQHFREANHACVMDLDTGNSGVAVGHG